MGKLNDNYPYHNVACVRKIRLNGPEAHRKVTNLRTSAVSALPGGKNQTHANMNFQSSPCRRQNPQTSPNCLTAQW